MPMILSIHEAKAHLRIQHDEEDAYLEALIRQAQACAEDFCHTAFSEAPPEPVRLAVLLYAGHFYAQRENADKPAYEAMLAAFHALLWPYREADKLF